MKHLDHQIQLCMEKPQNSAHPTDTLLNRSESMESSDSLKLVLLMKTMLDAFGSLWEYPQELPTTWLKALAPYSIDDVRRALTMILASGYRYPPKLPEFVELMKYGGLDFDAAFIRCIQRKPEGKVEQYVARRYGFDIRRREEKIARVMFESKMKQAVDLDRKGLLYVDSGEMPLLAKHSIKNTNDLAREAFQARQADNKVTYRPGSVFSRVEELGKGVSQ